MTQVADIPRWKMLSDPVGEPESVPRWKQQSDPIDAPAQPSTNHGLPPEPMSPMEFPEGQDAAPRPRQVVPGAIGVTGLPGFRPEPGAVSFEMGHTDSESLRRIPEPEAPPGSLGRMAALASLGVDSAVREAGATWKNIVHGPGLGPTLVNEMAGVGLPPSSATAEDFQGTMTPQEREANQDRSEGATAAERFAAGIAAMPASFLDPKTIAAMLISHSPTGAMSRAAFNPIAEAAIAEKVGERGLQAVRAVAGSTTSGAGFGAADAGLRGHDVVEGAAQGAVAGLPFALPGLAGAFRGRATEIQPEPGSAHPPELPEPLAKVQGETGPRESASLQPALRDRQSSTSPPSEAGRSEPVRGTETATEALQTSSGVPSSKSSKYTETVPESPATLESQVQALRDGKRDAVLVTEGAAMPDKGEFAALKTEAGTFIYDPKRVKPTEIKAAVSEDRVGDILGMGTPRKPAPEDSIGAVVVRSPEGVEKQAVVASDETLPAVTEAANKLAGPGDTVALESPQKVISERIESGVQEQEAANGRGVGREDQGQGIVGEKAQEARAVQRGVQEGKNEGLLKAPESTPDESGPELTSARKAMTTEDREAMGLDDLASPKTHSWQQALSDAKRKKIPDKAMDIAATVNAKPRALSDTETAGLVMEATRLKNHHREVLDQIEKATDPTELSYRTAEANRVEQDFDVLTEALRKSGTEKGRALASQKLTLNHDFELVTIKARAKASAGRALTEGESSRFADLTTKLSESDKRVAELERQMAEQSAERVVRQHKAKQRTATPEARQAEFADTLSQIRDLLKAGC